MIATNPDWNNGPIDDTAPVDLLLAARIMGEESDEALSYLLSLFQRTFPEVMVRLQIAISDGLPTTVAEAAHTAKGVAANSAARKLERTLVALEEAAEECRMSDVKTLFQEVQQETDRVISFMEAWDSGKRSQ